MQERKELADDCFNSFIELIHKKTGITIKQNKKAMLTGRLNKRMHSLQIKTYEEYLSFVLSTNTEEQYFIDAVTTNETYFYRTPRVWDFIESSLLPNLKKNELNVWSAASSTGEEAYTLGTILEDYRKKDTNFKYNILGSDISKEVVNQATKGVYKGRSIQRFRDTRPYLFTSYMQGCDTNGFSVRNEIKKNIKFKTHNLFTPFKEKKKFDLILLRNVLIYFNKEDQTKVIQNLVQNISKTGFLIIGESESLGQLESSFESVSPLIYKLKDQSEKI